MEACFARCVALVTLAACAAGCAGFAYANAHRVGGTDSAPVFDVLCHKKLDACYEKAAALCPSGYETSGTGGYQHTWEGDTEFRGYMLVTCKPRTAAAK